MDRTEFESDRERVKAVWDLYHTEGFWNISVDLRDFLESGQCAGLQMPREFWRIYDEWRRTMLRVESELP